MTIYRPRCEGDPRWIPFSKYANDCPGCRERIAAGSRIFYYPMSRTAYCRSCGEQRVAEIEATIRDKDIYNG